MTLEISGLVKTFGGLKAVNEASFVAHPGQVTGLVGPNGAGKSTLFNVVAGAYAQDAGTVTLDGEDISGLKVKERLNRGMARTFQDAKVIPDLSLIDNLIVGSADSYLNNLPAIVFNPVRSKKKDTELRDRAVRLLELVGVPESLWNSPASAVSYGHQKLVSLARCLMSEPRVILLDEPTSGLDTQTLEQFYGVIAKIASDDKIIIIVEHNMAVVRRICDSAVFLAEGKVLGAGRPEELMQREDLRKVYFGG